MTRLDVFFGMQVERLKKEVRKRDKELTAKQASMDEDLAMIEEAMAAETAAKVQPLPSWASVGLCVLGRCRASALSR